MGKLTFQDQYQLAQQIAKVSDTANTTSFKRDINTGGSRFLAALNRPTQRRSRFANVVANQQYYQNPEDALRPSSVLYLMGSQWVPLAEVTDETYWRQLNWVATTGIPTAFFVRGSDEIGLYPIPSSAVSAGLELVFELRHLSLSQADYTTGTMTVTNGSATATHSAAGLTSQMIGRYLSLTDGSDANWYKIADAPNSSTATLENVYQGLSAAATFRIGEVMEIPEEYLEAPVDYAMHRYFIGRDTPSRYSGGRAKQFLDLFDHALAECKSVYGRKASSAVVEPSGSMRPYNGLLDTPRTIGAP